jgi:hypothetical protein
MRQGRLAHCGLLLVAGGGGGAPSANAWDPSSLSIGALSNSDLTYTGTGHARALTGATGSDKGYFECIVGTGSYGAAYFGLDEIGGSGNYPGSTGSSMVQGNGTIFDGVGNTASIAFGATAVSWDAGDVLMMAVDMTLGRAWFGKNGTWANSGDPVAGTGHIWTGLSSSFSYAPRVFGQGGAAILTLNFGVGGWTYTPPTGFNGL